MDDLISRKAAIDAIMDADVCVTWNGVISDDDAVDIAIKSTKGSVISSIVNMPSAQPEQRLSCKNCIHLGHGYMMPCKNCKRNQMLPDWYEV